MFTSFFLLHKMLSNEVDLIFYDATLKINIYTSYLKRLYMLASKQFCCGCHSSYQQKLCGCKVGDFTFPP